MDQYEDRNQQEGSGQDTGYSNGSQPKSPENDWQSGYPNSSGANEPGRNYGNYGQSPYGDGPYWQNTPNSPYNNGEPPYGNDNQPFWQNENQPPRERNSLATFAFLCGLFGLLSLCCLAFPVAIICGVGAICFAVLSKKEKPFRGTAIVGIVLGALAIAFGIAEFFYVLAITNIMRDPSNAAALNQFLEQFERMYLN